MFEVIPYTSDKATEWNAFVDDSKQGTFLLNRNYMDYHSNRFADCSLMIYYKGKLFALLPANKSGKTLYSHQGLTYGGLITGQKATTDSVCEAFSAMNSFLKAIGIESVVYKAIPWIYHRIPAEEDLYALTHIAKAEMAIREISSAIQLDNRIKFSELRRRGIKKAIKANVSISESEDLADFWTILDNNLESKYHVRPVHSLPELVLLKSRFPKEIRLFMAKDKCGQPIGGTLLYETGSVVHSQYISASKEGKACGALDMLFNHIINNVYGDRERYANIKFFDFGKSTEDEGNYLNKNLIFQKEGFGGRGVCYDTYKYKI